MPDRLGVPVVRLVPRVLKVLLGIVVQYATGCVWHVSMYDRPCQSVVLNLTHKVLPLQIGYVP